MGGSERAESKQSAGSRGSKAAEHRGAERRTPLGERNDLGPMKHERPSSARVAWEARPASAGPAPAQAPLSQRDSGSRPRSARRSSIGGSAISSARASARALNL